MLLLRIAKAEKKLGSKAGGRSFLFTHKPGKPKLAKELSLNNFHISGRYPLPATRYPQRPTRLCFCGQREAGSAPGYVEIISGQFLRSFFRMDSRPNSSLYCEQAQLSLGCMLSGDGFVTQARLSIDFHCVWSLRRLSENRLPYTATSPALL